MSLSNQYKYQRVLATEALQLSLEACFTFPLDQSFIDFSELKADWKYKIRKREMLLVRTYPPKKRNYPNENSKMSQTGQLLRSILAPKIYDFGEKL